MEYMIKKINWKLVDKIKNEIDEISYWIDKYEKYLIKKKYISKTDIIEKKIIKATEIKSFLSKKITTIFFNILNIKNWKYIFSINENFEYDYKSLKNYFWYKSITDIDVKILKELDNFYFIDLFKELKEKKDEYNKIDILLFSIIYEIYSYSENKLNVMIFDINYFFSTLIYFERLIKNKDIEKILNFSDIVINIDFEDQKRLKNKIYKLYYNYINNKT